MCTWQQGVLFLAGKRAENVLISDFGTRGIYLSLTHGTAKFEQLYGLIMLFHK